MLGYSLGLRYWPSVFCFYPMLRTLYLSFFLTNSFGEPTVFVGFQNYLNLLTTKSYLASLQATGIYVVGVTVFTIIGGLLLAATANQRVRGLSYFGPCLPRPWAFPSQFLLFSGYSCLIHLWAC